MVDPYDCTVETELETGHVLVHCKQHQREWCHDCRLDFREINEDQRRASKAELSHKAAKTERSKPCRAQGCNNSSTMVCSACKAVRYCSKDCQKKAWKEHKKQCAKNLPTFVTSIGKKTIQTYPVGAKIEMVGGTSPLQAKILKFNPPGTGSSSDPTATNLATYSLRPTGANKSEEVWDEPCEDVHDEGSWRQIA